MKRIYSPGATFLIIFIMIMEILFSFSFEAGAREPREEEELYFPLTEGYYSDTELDYDYRENPFKITYADPREVNDMIWDHTNRTIYVACEYGIIIKDLETGKYDVISEWDGIEFRSEWEECNIDDIEMDWVNGRLFAISREVRKIYQIDIRTKRIEREYQFHMGANLLQVGHFRKMAYDHSRDVLFICKDTGLLVFHLDSGEIQFYDLYHFDIDLSFYRETTDGFELVTNQFFTITDLAFHEGTERLFIATTIGLYEFSIETEEIINYTADIGLDSEIRDLMLVRDTLYIGSLNLISFDVVTNVYNSYPVVHDNEYNYSVFSMGFDPMHDIIYACMVSRQPDLFILVAFDTESSKGSSIITDSRDSYQRSLVYGDDPISRVNKVIHPDPESGLVYLGRGFWEELGFEWKIEYQYDGELDKKRMNDDKYLYHLREQSFINASSRKPGGNIRMTSDCGSIFYTYNPENGSLGNYSLCGFDLASHNPDEEILIHESSGKAFLKKAKGNDQVFILSSEGDIQNELNFSSIKEIFLIGDYLYILDVNYSTPWTPSSRSSTLYRYSIINETMEMVHNEKHIGKMQKTIQSDEVIVIWDSHKLNLFDPKQSGKTNSWSGDITDVCLGNQKVYFSTKDDIIEYSIGKDQFFPLPNRSISGHRMKQIEYDYDNDQLYFLENGSLGSYDVVKGEISWMDLHINISEFHVNENGSGVIVKELSSYNYFVINRNEEVLPYGDLWRVRKIVYNEGTDSTIIYYYTGMTKSHFTSTNGIMECFPKTSMINSFCVDQERDLLYAITGPRYGSYSYSSEYDNGLIIYDMINGTSINLSRPHGLPSQMNHYIQIDEARGTLHILGERFYAVINIEDAFDMTLINDIPTLYVLNITMGEDTEVFGYHPNLSLYYTAAGSGA